MSTRDDTTSSANIGKRRKSEKKSKGGKRSRASFNRDDDSDDGYGNGGASRNPHPGSYANVEQRERFGVVVPDDDPADSTTTPQQNPTEQAMVKRTKRKFALLVGYIGSGYGGFQMNEEQRTIQAELELALLRSGLILRSNFGCPWKYGWSVSGRTDKGVHAAGQVVSCKLEVVTEENAGSSGATTEDDVRNLINEHLPSSMQVLDVVRTTRNFCAKTQRHRVRYQYLVPSFMLHSDLQELFRSTAGDPESAAPLLSPESVLVVQSRLASYRVSPRQLDALRSTLSTYHGTHTFHNFTKGMKPLEDRSKRYIESFEAGDPILLSGFEWIPTTVVGQSFLLHQIRKMIGMALLVASEASRSRTVDHLKQALTSADSVRVPTAPAQGLFLQMSVYETYNHRKNMSQNHEVQDILWGSESESPAQERYVAFRDHLLQHVGKEEIEEANFLQYLYKQHCGNRDPVSNNKAAESGDTDS